MFELWKVLKKYWMKNGFFIIDKCFCVKTCHSFRECKRYNVRRCIVKTVRTPLYQFLIKLFNVSILIIFPSSRYRWDIMPWEKINLSYRLVRNNIHVYIFFSKFWRHSHSFCAIIQVENKITIYSFIRGVQYDIDIKNNLVRAQNIFLSKTLHYWIGKILLQFSWRHQFKLFSKNFLMFGSPFLFYHIQVIFLFDVSADLYITDYLTWLHYCKAKGSTIKCVLYSLYQKSTYMYSSYYSCIPCCSFSCKWY